MFYVTEKVSQPSCRKRNIDVFPLGPVRKLLTSLPLAKVCGIKIIILYDREKGPRSATSPQNFFMLCSEKPALDTFRDTTIAICDDH